VKPGPSLKVALATIALGALIAVPSMVIVGVRGARTINAPSVATPGITQRQLSRGRWFVFERTGSRSGPGGFNFTQNGAPDLTPDQLKVTGPDGMTLAVSAVTVNDTLTKTTSIYTAAVQFDVPSGGRYTIEIDTATAGAVVITRSLGDTFRSILAPLGVAALGGLLGATGVVLLIVGTVRRSRTHRLTPATAGGGDWLAGPAGGAWTAGAPGGGGDWLTGPAGGGDWTAGAPGGGGDWTAGAPGGGWTAGPTEAVGPAPPGWYPDPQSAAGWQRWWDGTRWTEHRA
jgi:hypothetical protein